VIMDMEAGLEHLGRGTASMMDQFIVVIEPATGAILAKASWPTFDLTDVQQVIEGGDAGSGPLVDRTCQLYAPGSTFKVVTLAAALDSGRATLDSYYDAPAEADFGGQVVTNFQHAEYGTIDLRTALALSSNTSFARLGLDVGAETLVRYTDAFGFGTSLAQDFPCAPSLMPEPAEMTEWECAWAACGQPVGEHESPAGPQATIIQDAVIAQTIANGGLAMRPYIVDHVLSPEGAPVASTQPQALGQPITAETAAAVGEAMLGVVTNGTGSAAKVDGYLVAGKTGTAQVGGGTDNSLFIGYARARTRRHGSCGTDGRRRARTVPRRPVRRCAMRVRDQKIVTLAEGLATANDGSSWREGAVCVRSR